MRWGKPVCWGLGVTVILGLVLGLPVSLSAFVRWVKEPTYEESNRALDVEWRQLRHREWNLMADPHASEEEVARAHRESKKQEEEFEELKRRWKYRYNSRLEHVRQEMRRRLGW